MIMAPRNVQELVSLPSAWLLSSVTPKSLDLERPSASTNPSAARPRLSNSRTAEARLGMRFLKRQSSSAFSSSSVNMICRRSPRVRFDTVNSPLLPFGTNTL